MLVLSGQDLGLRVATGSEASALGFALQGADLELAFAQSAAPGDARSWTALRASADSVALLGTADYGLTLEGSAVSLSANLGLGSQQGVANTTTVNWSQAPVGTLNFAGPAFSLGATATIAVVGTLQASGSVAVSRHAMQAVVAGSALALDGLLIGATDLSASVRGVQLEGLNLGLALMRPGQPNAADQRSWLALRASATEVDLSGFGLASAGVSLNAKSIVVELNQGLGRLGGSDNLSVMDLAGARAHGGDLRRRGALGL